jgi:hypothetical protein
MADNTITRRTAEPQEGEFWCDKWGIAHIRPVLIESRIGDWCTIRYSTGDRSEFRVETVMALYRKDDDES